MHHQFFDFVHDVEDEYVPGTPSQPGRDFGLVKLVFSWLIAIFIALTLKAFAFQSYQVFGQSMEPTLHEGDYLIISKLGATWSNVRKDSYVPRRGDIVVLSAGDTRLIKRVIGLPGETVQVEDGQLTVFNQEHPEGFNPYETLALPSRYTEGSSRTQVPDTHVYVVGDNRQGGNSLDSRNQLGTVPTDRLVGNLILRFWPPISAKTF